MRTILAILLLLCLASSAMADKAADRQRGLRRTLLIIDASDLKEAQEVAVTAFGRRDGVGMFASGFSNDADKPNVITHYVAAIRWTPAQRAAWTKAAVEIANNMMIVECPESAMKSLTTMQFKPVKPATVIVAP